MLLKPYAGRATPLPGGQPGNALLSGARKYDRERQPDTMQQLIGTGKYRLAKRFRGFPYKLNIIFSACLYC
jgi:hypothetical protein